MYNEEIISEFYSAFSKRDHKTMNSFYSDEATFRDEVFDLKGPEIKAMWHMLCQNGKDLEIIFTDIKASDGKGSAYWEATYTFSATKRKVVNKINARFVFKDGKIIEHVDSFNFWAWSKQALGTPGLLLGWSGFLKNKVHKQAAKSLNAFISAHPEYQSNSREG